MSSKNSFILQSIGMICVSIAIVLIAPSLIKAIIAASFLIVGISSLILSYPK